MSKPAAGPARQKQRSYLSHPHREGRDYAKYITQLNSLLSGVEGTPAADWQQQSALLSQLARLVLQHKDMVGANRLADPQLLSRAIWHALDPQNVIGIQRKAVEFLVLYARFADKDPAAASAASAPGTGAAAGDGSGAGNHAAGQEQEREGVVADDPLASSIALSTVTRRKRGPVPVASSYEASGYVSPVQHDYPYLVVGVLELLPQSSIQLKPELLAYIEQIIRCLSPAALQTGLYGFVSAVLHGLEENENSAVFKQSMELLVRMKESVSAPDEGRRRAVRMAALREREAQEEAAEGGGAAPPLEQMQRCVPSGNANDKGSDPSASPTQPSSSRFTGGEAFFATLWSLLKDCAELRVPVLVLLKHLLALETEELQQRAGGPRSSPTATGSASGGHVSSPTSPPSSSPVGDTAAEKSFSFYTSAALAEELVHKKREWFGGRCACSADEGPDTPVTGPRRHGLVHTALFVCLQEKRERVLRLTLDLLSLYFPLLQSYRSEREKEETMPQTYPQHLAQHHPLQESAADLRVAEAMLVADGTRVILSPALTFDEAALLVAACMQLLAMPGSSTNVVRRVVSWLSGLNGGGDGSEHTASYMIAQAFTDAHRWWRSTHLRTVSAELGCRIDGCSKPFTGPPVAPSSSSYYYYDALYATALQGLSASAAEAQKHRLITNRAAASGGGVGGVGGGASVQCVSGHLFIPLFPEAGIGPAHTHLAPDRNLASAALSPTTGPAIPNVADWQLPLYLWLRAMTRLLRYKTSTTLQHQQQDQSSEGMGAHPARPSAAATGSTPAAAVADITVAEACESPAPSPIFTVNGGEDVVGNEAGGGISSDDDDPLRTRVMPLLLPYLVEWIAEQATLYTHLMNFSSTALLSSSNAALLAVVRQSTATHAAMQALLDVLPWQLISSHKAALLASLHRVAHRLRTGGNGDAGENGQSSEQGGGQGTSKLLTSPTSPHSEQLNWLEMAAAQVRYALPLLYHLTEVVEVTHMLSEKRRETAAQLAALYDSTWTFLSRLAEISSLAAQTIESCERRRRSGELDDSSMAENSTRQAAAEQLLDGSLELLKLHFFNVLSVVHQRLLPSTNEANCCDGGTDASAGGSEPIQLRAASSLSSTFAMSDAMLADHIESRDLLHPLIEAMDTLTHPLVGSPTLPSARWLSSFMECCSLVTDIVSFVGQLRWRERERMQQQSRAPPPAATPEDAEDGEGEGGGGGGSDTVPARELPLLLEPPSPRTVERCEATRTALAAWWRDLAVACVSDKCPRQVVLFVVKKMLAVARSRAMPEAMRSILTPLSPGSSATAATRQAAAPHAPSAKSGEEEQDMGSELLLRLWGMLANCSDEAAVEVVALLEQLAMTMGDRGKPLLDSLMVDSSPVNCQRITVFFHALLTSSSSSSSPSTTAFLCFHPYSPFSFAWTSHSSPSPLSSGAAALCCYFTGYRTLLQVLVQGPHHQPEAYARVVLWLHWCTAEQVVIPLLYAFAGDALTLDTAKEGPPLGATAAAAASGETRPQPQGTPFAKEAAHLVLQPDELTTMLQAILQLADARSLVRAWCMPPANPHSRSALAQELRAIIDAELPPEAVNSGAKKSNDSPAAATASDRTSSLAEAAACQAGESSLLYLLTGLLLSVAHHAFNQLRLGKPSTEAESEQRATDEEVRSAAVATATSVYEALNRMVALTQGDVAPCAAAVAAWDATSRRTVALLATTLEVLEASAAATPLVLQLHQLMLAHIRDCATFLADIGTEERRRSALGNGARGRAGCSAGSEDEENMFRHTSRGHRRLPLQQIFSSCYDRAGELEGWILLPSPASAPSAAGTASSGYIDDSVFPVGKERRGEDDRAGSSAKSVAHSAGVASDLGRAAPTVLSLRALYQTFAEGFMKASKSESALRVWGNFALDILPLTNRELPTATLHLLRGIVGLLWTVRRPGGTSDGEAHRARTRCICYRMVHCIIQFLCAVAAALDREECSIRAMQQKGSGGKGENDDAGAQRGTLWSQSPVLSSARLWLPTVLSCLITTLAFEEKGGGGPSEGREGAVWRPSATTGGAARRSKSGGGGGSPATSDDVAAAWALLRVLVKEAGWDLHEQFLLQWGRHYAPSEQLLRWQNTSTPIDRRHRGDTEGERPPSRSVGDARAEEEEEERAALCLAAERAALLLLLDRDGGEAVPLHVLVQQLDALLRRGRVDKNQRAHAAMPRLFHYSAAAMPAAPASVKTSPGPTHGLEDEANTQMNPLHEPTTTQHGIHTPLTVESLLFYFLDVLLSAFIRRRRDGSGGGDGGLIAVCFTPEVVRATIDFIAQRYSTTAPGYLTMATHLHTMRVLQIGASGSALSERVTTLDSPRNAAAGYFTDRRFAFVLQRMLECFSSTALSASSDLANHVFAYSVVAELLPLVVPPLPQLDNANGTNQQRVIDTAVSFFTRALLPTIKFGVQSVSEADLVARTPLVVAALRVTRAVASLGEPVAKRMRGDLMDVLVGGLNVNGVDSFFQFPATALREWVRLWEQLAMPRSSGGNGGGGVGGAGSAGADSGGGSSSSGGGNGNGGTVAHSGAPVMGLNRAFLALGFEKLNASSRAGGMLSALIKSEERDGQERAHLLTCLAFHTMALPSAAASDREHIRFVREQMSSVLKTFGSPAVPTVTFTLLQSGKVQLAPVRAVLLLFRALLLKDIGAQPLAFFWPMVVPELVRALSIHVEQRSGDADGAAAEDRAQERRRRMPVLEESKLAEVRALQLEALKVIDVAMTVCPDRFTSFRWVFLDDNCPGSREDEARKSTSELVVFSPLVRELVSSISPPSYLAKSVAPRQPHKEQQRPRQRSPSRLSEMRAALSDLPPRHGTSEREQNAAATSCLPWPLAEAAVATGAMSLLASPGLVEPLMLMGRHVFTPQRQQQTTAPSPLHLSGRGRMRSEPRWGGCARPLLSLPTTHYKRLAGVRVTAIAFGEEYALGRLNSGGGGGGGGPYERLVSAAANEEERAVMAATAEARGRRNDLWDRAYGARLFLTDLSCVDPDTGL